MCILPPFDSYISVCTVTAKASLCVSAAAVASCTCSAAALSAVNGFAVRVYKVLGCRTSVVIVPHCASIGVLVGIILGAAAAAI